MTKYGMRRHYEIHTSLMSALKRSKIWKAAIETLAFLTLLFGTTLCRAALIVSVDEPKQVGRKVVIKLTMKNTFTEKIESARAQVFLLDEKGSVTGQAARWVIGGTKDRPALAPGAETTFNFVIVADKPFATNRVSFTRVILEHGKQANVPLDVSVSPAAK